MAIPNYQDMERDSTFNAAGGKSDQTPAQGPPMRLPKMPIGVRGTQPTVDLTKPRPLPGWLGSMTTGASNLAQNAMGAAGRGIMNGGLNLKTWGKQPGVQAAPAPSAAPVANVPTVAPQAASPTSAQVRTPGDSELNASYDKGGYGPHSTEAQVNQARVGVQGPAPAARASSGVRPGIASPGVSGVKSGDPAREALVRGLIREQQAAAEHSQWQFPPGTGTDPVFVRNPHQDAASNYAAALGQYDTGRGHFMANDPAGQVGLIDDINASPARKGMYLASRGVDGQTIASLPGTEAPGQYNATNYDSPHAQQNPQTGPAAGVLAGDDPFHVKAAVFASIPGIENPNSPHRHLWDAYMARQQSQGPAFHQQLAEYNPGSPRGEIFHNNPFSQFWADVTGGDRSIQDRNARFHADMGRLGYGPARIGVQPNPDSQ